MIYEVLRSFTLEQTILVTWSIHQGFLASSFLCYSPLFRRAGVQAPVNTQLLSVFFSQPLMSIDSFSLKESDEKP